jgi:hypothetical protein
VPIRDAGELGLSLLVHQTSEPATFHQSRSDQYASALAHEVLGILLGACGLHQQLPTSLPAAIAGSSPLSIVCKDALPFKQIGVIDVVTAQSVAPRRAIMTTFTIDNDNNITAFGSAEEAAAATITPFDSFASQKELAKLAASWPAERLVAIWNSLPGVAPVKGFRSAKAAVGRIWERIGKLGEPDKPKADKPEPNAERKAKGGAQAAKGAPVRGKAAKKPTAAKNAPKAKKAAKAQEAAAPRKGSKTAQVVAMLQRKNGATLAEIMEKMGWQGHTVRGFMAGAMKKAGYQVKSFKPEGGERTYRISQ